ncbi:MAG TPA: hypothetical protein VMZ53_12340 [Kofleriaceae bacterium]|nr:hypothetical protein [Kofleriaceae bacterium]
MRFLLAAFLLAPTIAVAQPATGDRGDAKALMQTGVKLLDAKDYLGALATFKEAYSRYPSAKILLNIGTTLKLLGRDAEAANTYQRYLDSSDADAARSEEVKQALVELDAKLGRISIQTTPPDAEVQVGDEWMPAAKAKLVRFAPGDVKLSARKAGFDPASTTVRAIAGAETMAALTLTATLVKVDDAGLEQQRIEGDLRAHDELPIIDEPSVQRSRVGALANVHVAVYPKLGSAWLVGGTFDALPRLAIDAALLLGPGLVSDGMATLPPPSFGGYVGASYALMLGKLRPRALVGVPVFASDGARLFVRVGGGAEYAATRHLAVIVELAGEIALNPQNDIRDVAIVPALGVTGRL